VEWKSAALRKEWRIIIIIIIIIITITNQNKKITKIKKEYKERWEQYDRTTCVISSDYNIFP